MTKEKEKERTTPGLKEYIEAGYPCLFLQTVEPEVAMRRIIAALGEVGDIRGTPIAQVQFGVWKVTTGLMTARFGTLSSESFKLTSTPKGQQMVDALLYAMDSKEPVMLVFHNIWKMLENIGNVQQLIDTIMYARTKGSCIFLVGAFLNVPPELRSLINFVDCPLPTVPQIKDQYTKFIKAYEDEMDLPEKEEDLDSLLEHAATAAVGLDSMGAENAMALSMATSGNIDLKVIQSQKEQEIKKSDVLEFVKVEETIDDVGGFSELKEWLQKRREVFTDSAREYGLPFPKGVLIVGAGGCLSGDTVLAFTRGTHHGRVYTVRDAYYKFNQIPRESGGRHRPRHGSKYLWDDNTETKTLSLTDDGFIGYHGIEEIVFSGVQETFLVETESGRSIRVTSEHPFKVPNHIESQNGFIPLSNLKVGSPIMLRDIRSGGGGGRILKPYEDRRRVVHSVPFHPFAWDHLISVSKEEPWKQFNYKRIHFARLVIEAEMNGVSVLEMIRIVRSNPKLAARLKYLPPGIVVHHKDEDELNDRRGNLEPLSREEHDRLSGQKSKFGFRFSTAVPELITRIEKFGEEDTYDLVMKEPYHNYSAQGFIVHNTGKSLVAKAIASYLGLLCLRLDMGKVARSLYGESEAAMRLALQIVEAVAPVMLWIDEIDKGFSGIGGGGNLDGGVTQRTLQTFLTWRQETKAAVFIAATANEVSNLPSMVYRKGRFDEVWATDLPDLNERKEIFSIHIRKLWTKANGLSIKNYDLDSLAGKTADFTGAEIEECVKDAMFSAFSKHKPVDAGFIERAIADTIPQAKRDTGEVSSIRKWVAIRARQVSGKVLEEKQGLYVPVERSVKVKKRNRSDYN